MMNVHPSIGQMRNRMNSGHGRVLTAIADGTDIISPFDRVGDIRGKQTILDTLERWAVITRTWDGKSNHYAITERGLALINRV